MNAIARPSSKFFAVMMPLLQILGASLLIGVFAQIKIPLGFTPVPLSGQSFGVMFVALLLGDRKAPLAVLAYLLEGIGGLPVFAGGLAGVAHFFGPTGGYLIGFLLQSFLIGLLLRHWRINLFTLLLLTSLVMLGLGTVWLALFVGLEKALFLGFFPFIIGDLIKISAVAAYFRKN